MSDTLDDYLPGIPADLQRHILWELTAYPLSAPEETKQQLKAIGERVRTNEPGWEQRLGELFREDDLLTEAL